jgi:ATP-dependent Lon protease
MLCYHSTDGFNENRDEVDKVGQSNYHGDPSAALLEVLDPEQNVAFNACTPFNVSIMMTRPDTIMDDRQDHYINVPVDLSQVLFICMANTLDTIAPPLLDHCEVIQLSGYTHDERLHIAWRFLLPKQLSQNGQSGAHVQLTEPALLRVVKHYTREAGVRALERVIGGVVRFKAVEWAAHVDARGLPLSSLPSPVPSRPSSSPVSNATGALVKSVRDGDAGYHPVIKADELEKILGLSRMIARIAIARRDVGLYGPRSDRHGRRRDHACGEHGDTRQRESQAHWFTW